MLIIYFLGAASSITLFTLVLIDKNFIAAAVWGTAFLFALSLFIVRLIEED